MWLTHLKMCLTEVMHHCNTQLLRKYAFKTWWVWREMFCDNLRKQAAEHHITAWGHEQNALLGSYPASENMYSCTGQCLFFLTRNQIQPFIKTNFVLCQEFVYLFLHSVFLHYHSLLKYFSRNRRVSISLVIFQHFSMWDEC